MFRALDLEPYLESLNSGIISKRSSPPSGLPVSSGSNAISPAARTAMAIQARQQPKEATTLNSPEAIRQRSVAARSISSSMGGRSDSKGRIANSGATTGRGAVPARLDAATVQSYYAKGRRDFAAHNLEMLQLPRLDLTEATFHQANLRQVNLQGSTLTNVDFGRANLQDANLRDAILMKAYMSNADLQDADLRGADLRSAYLLNANLRGTNLGGANLTGAKITPEQFAMAKTNWMTVKPNGKRGGGW